MRNILSYLLELGRNLDEYFYEELDVSTGDRIVISDCFFAKVKCMLCTRRRCRASSGCFSLPVLGLEDKFDKTETSQIR